MPNFTPAETSEWVASNLRKAVGISNVEVMSDQVLLVSRTVLGPFTAGIISTPSVVPATIQSLVQSDLGVEIIVNVPKESFWTGGAIKLAYEHHIAIGSYGDLLRVIDLPEVRTFRSNESEFIERGLRQHNRVSDFERIHDRLYRLDRYELPSLYVAMLNVYYLTADQLRTAIDRYGRFSLVVITDPNGEATGAAEEIAHNMDIEILKWGQFFGRLNSR